MQQSFDRAALIDQQRKNLEFVEKWAASMPKVSGVSVVKALTYDLIQIVNRLGMSDEKQPNS